MGDLKIEKSTGHRGHMKDIMTIKLCTKGFYTEINSVILYSSPTLIQNELK